MIPEDCAISSESEITTVDFVESIAIEVPDCRDICGVFRITEPLISILPEQFQFMVESEQVHTYFHNEILGSRISAEVGNHQSLMDVVGDMAFAFGISVALAQRIRRGGMFDSTRRAV